ncbi:MAG: vitamin B12 dependent-methionine synthase activation domain-containing protein [Acidobacteriota bacterium]
MHDGARVLDLETDLRLDEVRRFLGYPRGREGSSRVEDRLFALWDQALELIAGRGACTLVGREDALRAGVPAPADSVGVAVCTIGPALEGASARLAAGGELLDALVFDAIGSAAAEACADALNLELCRLAEARGVAAAARVSPGYGDWDTTCQAALLALLPIEAVGVRLTSGGMMAPRKSVSFAVNLVAPGDALPASGSRCRRCGLPRCRHRDDAGPV